MSEPNVSEMTAQEYAMYRVEMTRRGLMELLCKVEPGTETGRQLAAILEIAVDNVEALANEEKEDEDEED